MDNFKKIDANIKNFCFARKKKQNVFMKKENLKLANKVFYNKFIAVWIKKQNKQD